MPVLENQKIINGLSPGTSYEWQLRKACNASASIVSDWTDTLVFTTQFCDVPSLLSESEITSNSAVLNWEPVPAALGYRIRGQKLGSSGWAVHDIEDGDMTSLLLNDLAPAT